MTPDEAVEKVEEMSEIVKSYRGILDSLYEGTDWRSDEREHHDRVSDAGVAVTVAVLAEGRSGLRWLRGEIPDFTAREIAEAQTNLLSGGAIGREGNRSYINASEDELDDGIWWALQQAVACGWLERTAA